MFHYNTDKNRNEELSQRETKIKKRLNIQLLSQTRIIHDKIHVSTNFGKLFFD